MCSSDLKQKQFTSEELLAFIRTSLDDAKAIDPAEIDLKGKIGRASCRERG